MEHSNSSLGPIPHPEYVANTTQDTRPLPHLEKALAELARQAEKAEADEKKRKNK